MTRNCGSFIAASGRASTGIIGRSFSSLKNCYRPRSSRNDGNKCWMPRRKLFSYNRPARECMLVWIDKRLIKGGFLRGDFSCSGASRMDIVLPARRADLIVGPRAQHRLAADRGVHLVMAVNRAGDQFDLSSDALTALLEASTEALCALDRNLRFVFVNDRLEKLIGRRRDELIGRQLWDFFPDAPDSSSAAELRRAMQKNAPFELRHFSVSLNRMLEIRAQAVVGRRGGQRALCRRRGSEITRRKRTSHGRGSHPAA